MMKEWRKRNYFFITWERIARTSSAFSAEESVLEELEGECSIEAASSSSWF
jgi:porphobilinogen deaminase